MTSQRTRLYCTVLSRPCRLAVRTLPFHGGSRGSIPLRVANSHKHHELLKWWKPYDSHWTRRRRGYRNSSAKRRKYRVHSSASRSLAIPLINSSSTQNPIPAPPELSRFAFLIGQWRCEAKLKREDGTWESLSAIWEGRYILDGYAIADEYRMTTLAGELLVLGINMRAYDSKKKTWNMKWLNALAGTWVDLGPEKLGGVAVDEKAI